MSSQNQTLVFLQGLFPGRASILAIEAGRAAFNWADQTSRNRLTAGKFPIPTYSLGGRRMVRLDALARFMDQASGDTAKRPTRGRPSKKEELEAARLGLSVRELRAQQALELGEGDGF